ncbi:MAG: AMP-binding protein [Acidimicrobiia bacterium]|nr:AMP-binding protein [Acidimicrobiia bacterium]
MVDLVGMHASYKADDVALVQDERSLTWGEYNDAKNRLANALVDLGISRDDKVICYLHNCIERFLLTNAADTLGVTCVPMSYRLIAPEVSYIVNDSEAAYVLFGPEFGEVIAQVEPECPGVRGWISTHEATGPNVMSLPDLLEKSSPDAPEALAEGGGVMLYTSGTTGHPKGAYREPGQSTDELRAQWFGSMLSEFDIRGGDDVHLVCGPLYHGAPFSFSMIATGVGSKIVIMPKFDAEKVAELVESHRVGYTVMAPVLVKRFLALDDDTLGRYDLSSLHTIVTTGAPCPPSVKEELFERVGPVLYEFYGSTELSVNTVMKPDMMLEKLGSCGKEFPGVELVVLDEEGNECATGEPGEVFARKHPLAFSGYYRKDEATRNAYHGEDLISVGDVAYVDEDGYFYICDRKTDMIISGGVNIYPAEIENVLNKHPKILDVTVFGIPDDEFGEQVHAVVELRAGETLTLAELKDWSTDKLADYKRPRSLDVVDHLPRDDAGKLRKRELRDPFWEGHATRV